MTNLYSGLFYTRFRPLREKPHDERKKNNANNPLWFPKQFSPDVVQHSENWNWKKLLFCQGSKCLSHCQRSFGRQILQHLHKTYEYSTDTNYMMVSKRLNVSYLAEQRREELKWRAAGLCQKAMMQQMFVKYFIAKSCLYLFKLVNFCWNLLKFVVDIFVTGTTEN